MFQALVFESHHLVIISIRKALIARKKETISGILHMNLSLTISQVFGMNDMTGNCFLNFPSTNKGLQLKRPRRKEQIIINKNKIA